MGSAGASLSAASSPGMVSGPASLFTALREGTLRRPLNQSLIGFLFSSGSTVQWGLIPSGKSKQGQIGWLAALMLDWWSIRFAEEYI